MISRRAGISLVEILIGIGIICLLLQLMLPSIEASREAARRTVCQNNLRQIIYAAQLHLDSHRHFPTGGWSSVWVGDPNRGVGQKQPGGWSYNLLPFLEETALHDLGKGMSDIDRRAAAAQMFATPVSTFVCPSRRLAKPLRFNRALFNSFKPDFAGRSDYAASIGNLQPSDQRGPGPATYDEGATWIEGTDRLTQWVGWDQNGVVFQRSTVGAELITDGLSKTLFAGEKFLAPRHYINGKSDGDDQSLYIGFDRDNARSTNGLHPPIRDANIESEWLGEGDDRSVVTWNFGSAHTEGLNTVLCDGAVEFVTYDIDPAVFIAKGSCNGSEK